MPLPPNTLNQALDQLPQILLNLGRLQQDRRDEQLRREIQQASQDFQLEMINKRLAASKELEQFRAGLEVPEEPPEVAILGRRIEKDLDILRDPNTALTLNESEINTVKNRVNSNLAERRRLSGRDYPVDPSLIELAPTPKPPPAADITTAGVPPPPRRKAKGGREIRPRWKPPEVEVPFSEEIATRLAGIRPLHPPATITTDEEFEALPSGAVFTGPDGVTRTKP